MMPAFAIIALCVCVGLHVADVMTTNIVLAQGGTEANGVMRWAQRNFGSAWWLALKALPVAVVVGLAWWFGGATGVLGVCVGSAAWTLWAVFHNVGQMDED